MKSINRRDAPRIDVKLQCHVTSPRVWADGFVGVTENISRTGILLVWAGRSSGSRLPRVGDLITMDIELPAHHDFPTKCIHCQGTVVRVAVADNQAPRVALHVSYMKFRDYGRRVPGLRGLEAEISNWST
jgi:c-di-GMP-binding flagellar brake protein YcgR